MSYVQGAFNFSNGPKAKKGAIYVPSPMALLRSLNIDYIRVDDLSSTYNAKTQLTFHKSNLNDSKIQSLTALNSTVAVVKTARSQKGAEDLVNEINAIRLLKQQRCEQHPNIVRLAEWDELKGWWMVTDLLAGGSLSDLKRRMRPDQVCPTLFWHVLKQLIDALAFLHGHLIHVRYLAGSGGGSYPVAIAHCDINEHNICFDLDARREFEGLPNIRLIDFGLAKATVVPPYIFHSSNPLSEPIQCLSPPMDEVHSYVRGAHFNDLAEDITYAGLIVHRLAHPEGFGQNGNMLRRNYDISPDGKCIDCDHTPEIWASRTAFTAADKDFCRIMDQLGEGRMKSLQREDYMRISGTANERRAKAFQNIERGEEIPEIVPVIQAKEDVLAKAVAKQIETAEREGERKPWIAKWREILTPQEEQTLVVNPGKGQSDQSTPPTAGNDVVPLHEHDPSYGHNAEAGHDADGLEVFVEHASDEDGDIIMTG